MKIGDKQMSESTKNVRVLDVLCPHCEMGLCLEEVWIEKEYPSSFDCTCPHCDKVVKVTVEQVPEFSVEQGEEDEDEEYEQAKVGVSLCQKYGIKLF